MSPAERCTTSVVGVREDAQTPAGDNRYCVGGVQLALSCRAVPARVAIVMGSDSDEETMRPCWETLADFGVEYEVRVLSAHRTPDDTIAFVRSAPERGVGVVICGAGGAAHLPGVAAAVTSLPVIGVPISSGGLGGLDALLAIVQMPRGVPVATVGVDNAANSALLAVRMLALADSELGAEVDRHRERMAEEVRAKDAAFLERLRG